MYMKKRKIPISPLVPKILAVNKRPLPPLPTIEEENKIMIEFAKKVL